MDPGGVPSTSHAPRASTISVGFVKADSSNLPHMDECMILEYMASSSNHNIAEIRGAKALMSSRDSYLESAVGYVEIQRTAQNGCVVRAKVTPEHKISSKHYIATVAVNESEKEIKDASCDGCAAAAGGCKHALVLMFWLSKKSNEPASTSVTCYWRKPRLSSVRTEPLQSKDVFKHVKKMKLMPKDPNILIKFKEESEKNNCKDSLISLFLTEKKMSYNLFDMTLQHVKTNQNIDFNNFKQKLDEKITPEVVREIEAKTKEQANCKQWHSMRQGRITASTIYEASVCKTDGSLVQRILGGYKVPETNAIKRGKMLESKVIKQAEILHNQKIHPSGLILINSLFGASPDGVAEDFVVEVKCPVSEKTFKNYVCNGEITKKIAAHMQLQMLAAEKHKALFCVADPLYETNKKIHFFWLQYDAEYTEKLVEDATTFWENFVFKKIIKSAL